MMLAIVDQYDEREITVSPVKVRELVRDIIFALLGILFNRKDGAQQDSASRPRTRIVEPEVSLSRSKLEKASSSSTDQAARRNEAKSADHARPASDVIQPVAILSTTQAAVVPGAAAQVRIARIMQADALQSSASVAQEDGMVIDTGIRTLNSKSESDSDSDSSDGQEKSDGDATIGRRYGQ